HHPRNRRPKDRRRLGGTDRKEGGRRPVMFTSFKFLLILPLIVGLYHVVPLRCRVLFLVLVSYGYVCTFSVRAALALAVATGFTFLAGKAAGNRRSQQRAYAACLCAIAVLTLYLCFFKVTAA